MKIIEKELWNTLYGIPLFAHPGIAGSDAKMQNVRPTATQDGIPGSAPRWLNSWAVDSLPWGRAAPPACPHRISHAILTDSGMFLGVGSAPRAGALHRGRLHRRTT